MDFSFTSEQQAIRETARRFAEERLRPGYQQREKDPKLDRALVRDMGKLGLIAPTLPEAHGGLGASAVTAGIVMEELARGDFNLCYLQLLGMLNGQILERFAQPDVAKHWLPAIAGGEAISALALTEPGQGSDAAHIKLRARPDGKRYILSGEKTSISMAVDADLAIVFARTGRDEDGAHGISAFAVPMDSQGISRTRIQEFGSVIVGRGSIFFDDVAVPAEFRLGDEGRGFTQVMQGFDFSRALIGLQCVGAAAQSLAETWPYVAERKAFGTPIVKFEGVSFPLAEGETWVEAAKLLCYKTLWLKDTGQPHTAEAAMCKWWAPKMAFDAIHQCLLMHGHAGYGLDYAHQQRLRDVLGLQIGDGTAQIMKLIIARERVGRVAVPY
jgi:cyclohexanecarboxyl-CoA dehydrogenase